MKTFRLFGIAVIVILVSAHFMSCSSDDDETKNVLGFGKSKKIKKIGIAGQFYYTFEYNENDKLSYATYYNSPDMGNPHRSYEFIWERDSLVVTELLYGQEDHIALKNNMICKINGYWQTYDEYVYNESNKLRNLNHVDHLGKSVESYVWEGDKLMSLTYKDHNGRLLEKYRFTYDGVNLVGYNPFLINFVASFSSPDPSYLILFLAHPELVGFRSSQLPSSSVRDDYFSVHYSYTTNYEYEFNSEGYIIKIVAKTPHEVEANSMVEPLLTINWE